MNTKLGVSPRMLTIALYVSAVLGGMTLAFLGIAGYILLVEKENEALKGHAIKAFTIVTISSLLVAVIGLIPDAVTSLNHLAEVVNGGVSLGFLKGLFSFAKSAVYVLADVILLMGAASAYLRKDLKIKAIDDGMNKMDLDM